MLNLSFLASKRWAMRNGHETVLKQSFGAVSSVTPEIFKMVNGYSNLYWGWGAEDDDLLRRLMSKGKRPIPRRTDSHYNWQMIEHGAKHFEEGNAVNKDRFRLKDGAVERMETDGLNTLRKSYEIRLLLPTQ